MYQIFNYILSGLVIILTPILYTKLIIKSPEKIFTKEKIILTIISVIFTILTQLILNNIIKTLALCIIFIITIKRIFNIDYWKSTILIIIYIALMMLIEGFDLIFIIYVLKLNKEFCYTQLAGGLLLNIIITIETLLVILLLKNQIKKILNYELDNNKKLIAQLCLALFSTLYCFYDAFTNIVINKNFLISIAIIAAFMIVLINLIYQLIINSQKGKEYDKLLEFMKIYEKEIELQRTQRHETKNQLLTIKAKIYDKEDKESIVGYIDNILDEKIVVSQEHYAKFQYLPANGIKALFYFKTSEAERKGVKVSINISKRLENSILYNLNATEFNQLGKLIGIYIDNAIEASSTSQKKELGIEIYLISNNVEIIITNSYDDNKKVISNNGKSTKGKNRGHGLLLAKNIIEFSDRFACEKTITNKIYTRKLIIHNNK